jgi:DNA modification methylase
MNPNVTLINTDCAKALQVVEPESVDSVVTDPPYEIGFNGSKWDKTGIAYDVAMWGQVHRVAKPGSYLLAFGGTRTFHRMTCAIEDAGFEIQDCCAWIYGNGFPKHESKLKPAWEPIVLARKHAPHATPLNIDASRINGRWPPNVMLDELAGETLDADAPNAHPSRFFYIAKATPDETFTTGCAAVLEHRGFLGIEREKPFFRIGETRVRHWKEVALSGGN